MTKIKKEPMDSFLRETATYVALRRVSTAYSLILTCSDVLTGT